MGSVIELNDTLQITTEQGFPSDLLDLQKHTSNPVKLSDLDSMIFEFSKPGARIFHLEPTRVFLVQNIDGKWLFWGHAYIQSQSINRCPVAADGSPLWVTSGTYRIVEIYDPEYQKLVTLRESRPGASYF